MKTYKATISLTFTGTVDVKAKDIQTAREYIEKHFGAVAPNIHTSLSDNEIPNWDFPFHPVKKIINIKKH